jgi:hypothetical protein
MGEPELHQPMNASNWNMENKQLGYCCCVLKVGLPFRKCNLLHYGFIDGLVFGQTIVPQES